MSNKEIWKHVVGNVRNSYGETDTNKHIIKINKKYHKSKGNHSPGIRKNPDGSANLLDTILHETDHAQHPKMHEKTVRKRVRKQFKKLTRKRKRKLYSEFNH